MTMIRPPRSPRSTAGCLEAEGGSGLLLDGMPLKPRQPGAGHLKIVGVRETKARITS